MAEIGDTPSAGDLRVGDWEVDPRRNEVRKGSSAVRLEPKAIEVLVFLAGRAGDVVAREEMLAALWPGVIVGDDVLTQAIIKLRKAFDDDAREPRYIETISKRGYRLIAPVTRSSAAEPRPRRMMGRWAVAGAAAVLAIAAAAVVFQQRIGGLAWPVGPDVRGAESSAPPLIAVLPLTNLGGDAKQEYFSDGITEDLIGALGRFPGLRVLSRNAVQSFKGGAPAPDVLRGQLGVRYLVQGSVRESGGRVRLTVQLSDVERGTVLWSERYDGEGSQVLEIQDRIVSQLAGALAVRVNRLEEARTVTKTTGSLEAYDLLLRARSLLDRSNRGANREARALLSRARALAPDYPEISNALAEAEFQRAAYGWVEDPDEALKRAQAHALEALASPDSRAHSRAHALLASTHIALREVDEALSHANRAIELNPSDAIALARRGGALLLSDRIDEAIASLEAALRLDPLPGGMEGYHLALAYHLAGRYRDALARSDAMVARMPDHVYLNSVRAASLAQLGNEAEARIAAQTVRKLNPYFDVASQGVALKNPRHRERFQDALRRAGL